MRAEAAHKLQLVRLGLGLGLPGPGCEPGSALTGLRPLPDVQPSPNPNPT